MPNENEPNVTGYFQFPEDLIAVERAFSAVEASINRFVRDNYDRIFRMSAALLWHNERNPELQKLLSEYIRMTDRKSELTIRLNKMLAASDWELSPTPPENLPGTLHDYLSDE